jgi:MFS transporter, DHA1 family, solute carrier family 18 (vesicular amine transporter), member 1/2
VSAHGPACELFRPDSLVCRVHRAFVSYCHRLVSLKSSRAFAVSLVTFAAFTDLVAYSIAVPVLPDLSRRLGASPTVIGFLFASFGLTLLTFSLPMGAASDRVGRKPPLVIGLVALAAASLMFAFGRGLSSLFLARLVQGAADAVTWVVGFALLADLYGPAERGRVMGLVMSGSGFGLMIGPSLGGWLYQVGGISLPFLAVAVLAAIGAAAFSWIDAPPVHQDRETLPLTAAVRIPALAVCVAAVVTASAVTSMLEPVLPLFLSSRLGLGPARIGFVFGTAALATMVLHPVYGRLSDRWGARRLTLVGLALSGSMLPVVSQAWNYGSAIGLYILQAAAVALVITPSLAYMAEAASAAGYRTFGLAYGLYNVAWGAGLLVGPSLGGFLFEQLGFVPMTLVCGPLILLIALGLGRVKSLVPGGQAGFGRERATK